MVYTNALPDSGLASTWWMDKNNDAHIRVYYQDVDLFICEVKCDKGIWIKGSQRCFATPTKTSLAAIPYLPGDGNVSNIPPDLEVEIRLYTIDKSNSTPTIVEYSKSQTSGIWSKNATVPTYDLYPDSALGAVEYRTHLIRVFYQDKSGYIRVSQWGPVTNHWVVSTGGANLRVSDAPAHIGTPIGAVQGPWHYLNWAAVVWQDNDNNIEGSISINDVPKAMSFPTKYPASPSGSITVATWSTEKTSIYYGGKDGGIQKLELNNDNWSGPINVFTGNILDADVSGSGGLASAAYTSDAQNAADHWGTVFYQPGGQGTIVEILI
ncbi:hypothetical protein SISSUDRAFT_1035240 [Sistotremastrum suecicum HHB10207 ss-3]|uniref:Uncharacterized protein n=1 Tax=Sistotremastrum suecicum HHB10207 ss-3 TaxID=1314776 RepID=A0A166B1K0_9AGAM|nr:hypothetical protein SISSUDRAFT_1035240 [Sistotremastrum suecicum HHB10207 ss-3]